MKGIYLKEPWDISMRELEEPAPKEGEALIRVKSAGICGSDIGAFRGSNPLVSYPRVIGHEIAGEILYIPENSKGLQAGDRVIVISKDSGIRDLNDIYRDEVPVGGAQ